MTGNTFSREELIAAFEVFEQTVDRAAHTRDWDPWTDHYTEDVLYMLHGLGIHTGVDLEAVVRAGDYISQAIGRTNSSRVGRALLTKWAASGEAAPACV